MSRHPNSRCDLGPLGKVNAKHYAPAKVIWTREEVSRVTNATVDPHKSPLTTVWTENVVRPGAMTAYSLPSRGLGC